ncbi:MAG TPA: MCP four helix bundle domain-containing protein, partial [Burkholderiaceae bacterium]|nr:MCP four helix bundle domain-containing protein [Burkholderiaceae bacterium]
MKVGTRLSLGFGLVLLSMVVLITVGLLRFNEVGALSERIIGKDWVKAEAVNTIDRITRANARNTLELFLVSDKARATEIYQRIEANKKAGDQAFETLEKLLYVPEAKTLLADIKEKRGKYVASFKRVSALLEEDKRDEATTLMNMETLPALDALQKPISTLLELQDKLVTAGGVEIRQNIDSAGILMLALGGLALGIGLLAGFLITRRLLAQLGGEPDYAMAITRQIAAGDLSDVIHTRDGDQDSLLFAMKTM